MLKSQLIQRLGQGTKGISHEDIAEVINVILETMSSALEKHHRIEIRGFGTFTAKQRRSRLAHNPKTGVKVSVPPKWVPFFVPGKELRERVNHAP